MIRWMIRRDMDRVVEIDEASFHESWDDKRFLTFLKKRENIGMIVEDNNETVIGYFLYSLKKDCYQMVRFAIHPSFQRKGWGTTILQKMFGKLSYKRNRIVIDVPDGDLHVHLFLRANEYRAIEVRDDEYRFCREELATAG